jgi:FAD/FMN-containing dehydrogenase
MKLTNAGNYPVIDTKMTTLRSQTGAIESVAEVDNCIARGKGNGIGDSALNDSIVFSALGLDKMISFDEEAGILISEAGVILEDISRSFAIRGWFLATTPGTSQISLGGAVAADVHGKNHHIVGSFCNHVIWFDILTASQGVIRCSPEQNSDLFYATCGGFGLTGIILTVAIKMIRVPSLWIKQFGIKTRNLSETLESCRQYSSSTYTVAWVDPHAKGDSMGRGYLMCGDFASNEDLDFKKTILGYKVPRHNPKIPLFFPVPLLNSRVWTEIINSIYRVKSLGISNRNTVSMESFFYPLQSMNLKMVGGGHITYQFVLPYSASNEGIKKIFKKIVDSKLGSPISVLKLFGHQKRYSGNISYPIEGFNLGIDFKVSDEMFKLFRELDAMVLDYDGRHYLAKDVSLSPETLRKSYGKSLIEFLEVKAKWDPMNRFRSLQSMRLGLY